MPQSIFLVLGRVQSVDWILCRLLGNDCLIAGFPVWRTLTDCQKVPRRLICQIISSVSVFAQGVASAASAYAAGPVWVNMRAQHSFGLPIPLPPCETLLCSICIGSMTACLTTALETPIECIGSSIEGSCLPARRACLRFYFL